jgi:hypothetical protein
MPLKIIAGAQEIGRGDISEFPRLKTGGKDFYPTHYYYCVF